VRYALADAVALAGGYTRQGLGGAVGRRNAVTWPDTYDLIRSVWAAEAYWVGAAIYPVRNLRIAVGPGRYRLESEDHQFTKVGLLAEIGLEVFMGRHFFLDLGFREHRVGTREVGPSGVTLRADLNYATAEIGWGFAF
jgi:opacity protein-like surface antigen